MPLEKTKDTTIRGQRYEIGRMSPLTASLLRSWLVRVAVNLASKDPSPDAPPQPEIADKVKHAEGMVGMLWLMASQELGRENYSQAQTYALQVCKAFSNEDVPPIPVLMADGKRFTGALGDDPVAVDELITASLQFNVAPFFIEAMSNPPTAT